MKKEKNNSSKSMILIIICVIILIFAVIGVSYAAIFYSRIGEKVNRVTTGTITMSYSETTNGINLTDANPMTDEVGRKLNDENQYFDFTVSATMSGNVIINYIITATKEDDSTLPDSAVKVYLTNINSGDELEILKPTKISDLNLTSAKRSNVPEGQFLLYSSSFNQAESRSYRLRMWVASDYILTNVSQSYKLRVNVYGNVEV